MSRIAPRAESVCRDAAWVEGYLARELPHRELAEELLLEALPERVERFLDLGSGDGRLLRLVAERHPEADGIGLDFSAPMLARARDLCRGNPWLEVREHDLRRPLALNGRFDAIVSGAAIHHLDHRRKRALFGEVHDLLSPGGVFANLDLVRADSPEIHARFRGALRLSEDDPADRPAPLVEQLGWLRDAGFERVDCRFLWLELALLVAIAPPGRSA